MSAQVEDTAPSAVTAQAPAMVAVANQVGERQEFGGHSVLSLKVGVSRYDVATVAALDGKEILVSFEDASNTPIEYAEIPHEDLASVFQAVDELRKYLSRPKERSGVDITIQKRIPFETHLGGRAASAAAVLVALTRVWEASIAREELARIAQRVGDGVAEAITGGAVITHTTPTEELVTPILVQGELAMVIVPAAADLDDTEMFANVYALRSEKDQHVDRGGLQFDSALVEAVARGDSQQLALMMHNDFQSALVSILPDHNDWLTAGMAEGALAAQTVDRGPSLVFITENLAGATELAERFEQRMEIAAVAEYGPVAGAHLI